MKTIKIHADDNVAVVIEAEGKIPFGHKLALAAIPAGEHVIKYGHPIGSATSDIQPGEHVHVHNVKTNLSGTLTYSYNPIAHKQPSGYQIDTFMGYRRSDGKAGVRNEIWVISTVGCVNKIAEKIARLSGAYTFSHPYGCSQLGDDHEFTQNILKGLVNHPNAGGVLVLGLGCENNNIAEFQKILKTWDDERVKFLNVQDVRDDVEEGIKLVKQLHDNANQIKREPIPVKELVIGLKCGGSDGLSGITANPLVGKLSDYIIDQGGSCVLTEVPEMFGAEALLLDRCVSDDVFNKSVDMINGFKEYFIRHGQVVYENPTLGNKEGGITTLEEKSLGCTQKGGAGPVVDALYCGETVTETGLSLLNGPGNDIVAVTNLVAAGVHIVLFTTGRGTPLGGPVPTVKISSNSALAKAKPGWIDFNAGAMLEGNNMEKVAKEFIQYVMKVASGELVKNEVNDYREIAIFKDGVTM